jgi:hypothetical protein
MIEDDPPAPLSNGATTSPRMFSGEEVHVLSTRQQMILQRSGLLAFMLTDADADEYDPAIPRFDFENMVKVVYEIHFAAQEIGAILNPTNTAQ